MRHLTNLNIFHWTVIVVSPRPAAQERACVRAPLQVHSNVNYLCIGLWVTMCVLVRQERDSNSAIISARRYLPEEEEEQEEKTTLW